MKWGKLGLFAGGVLFGTAGIGILKSKDMQNAYTHCAAAVLRGKDAIVKTGTKFRESCSDMAEDARDINEQRRIKAEEKEVEKARAVVAAYEEKQAEK